MMIPPAAPIFNPINNFSQDNPVDRGSVQVADNGESRRVSADINNFVREPKSNQPVENQPNQKVATQQDIEDIQRQDNLIPSPLKTGPRGSNIDFYV